MIAATLAFAAPGEPRTPREGQFQSPWGSAAGCRGRRTPDESTPHPWSTRGRADRRGGRDGSPGSAKPETGAGARAHERTTGWRLATRPCLPQRSKPVWRAPRRVSPSRWCAPISCRARSACPSLFMFVRSSHFLRPSASDMAIFVLCLQPCVYTAFVVSLFTDCVICCNVLIVTEHYYYNSYEHMSRQQTNYKIL